LILEPLQRSQQSGGCVRKDGGNPRAALIGRIGIGPPARCKI
jgi:hypothetical protein